MALQPQSMQQPQPTQGAQQPAQDPAAQQPPEQGAPQQPQVSDEQMKAMFEEIAAPQIEYIYGAGLQNIKSALEPFADDPAQGIANVVGRMLSASALQARENGGMIPPKVMTALGMELVNNVTDIAVQTGTVTQQEANDVGENAFVKSLQVFGETIDDLAISQQELDQYMQIVDEIESLMQVKGGGNAQPQQQAQPKQAPEAQPQQPQPSTMAQAATGA